VASACHRAYRCGLPYNVAWTTYGRTPGGTLNDGALVAEVEALYYAYPPLAPGDPPAEALRGVSFGLARGEFVAVMGPSGAGKTTLCLALCAIVPHSTGGVFGGRVVVCGQDTRRTRPAQLSARVGVVFQDPEGQILTTAVEDEVAFGLESQGLPRDEIARRVSWALEQVSLADHRRRNPSYLSGGQKQRVAIAAAIATRPDLLVLDEPTASLDPVGS
jgi:energy-coupling factor transport system ATP-binding protein